MVFTNDKNWRKFHFNVDRVREKQRQGKKIKKDKKEKKGWKRGRKEKIKENNLI